MNVLALETSVKTGSLAVWRDDRLTSEVALPSDEKTAASLFVEIERALRDATLQANDIDLVAVSTGPGSFTGLRIGVTFAKTFAYATDAKIAAVPTSLSLAYAALCGDPSATDRRSVDVTIDAQRQQIFAQSFELNEADWPVATSAIRIVSRMEWWQSAHASDCITGPGLDVLEKFAASPSMPVPAPELAAIQSRCLPPTHRQPRATHVGLVGMHLADRDQITSPWELKPEYGRQSAAEEKANDRRSSGVTDGIR